MQISEYTVEEVRELPVNEAVLYALQVSAGGMRNLIRMKHAVYQLGSSENDIIFEFASDLLLENAKAVYAWQGRARLSTYILTIFRNWLTAKLSGGSRRREDLKESMDEFTYSEVKDPLMESLHECIDALESHAKTLVERVYFGGEKVSTLARGENLDQQRIYRKIYGALDSIYQCLEAKGFSRKDFF